MVDELLAKRLTLVGVFDGLFVADSGETDALDDDANSFMVEVRHDDYRSAELAATLIV